MKISKIACYIMMTISAIISIFFALCKEYAAAFSSLNVMISVAIYMNVKGIK